MTSVQYSYPVLPPELQELIVSQLDFATLLHFTVVSPSAHACVEECIRKNPKKYELFFQTIKEPEKKIPAIFRKITSVNLSERTSVDNKFLEALIKQMERVTEITLTNTSITSLSPLCSQQDNIQVLNISFCALLDAEAVSHLSEFPNLHTIDQKFTAFSKNSLRTSTPLRALDLRGCAQLGNDDIVTLARSLRKLSLQGTNISDIKDMPPTLMELDISDCRALQTSSFSEIQKFTNLEKLYMRNNRQITSLTSLTTLSSLHTVDVSYSGEKKLPSLRNIEVLVMENTSFTNWNQLLELTRLKTIDVSRCRIDTEKRTILTELETRKITVLGIEKSLRRTWS